MFQQSNNNSWHKIRWRKIGKYLSILGLIIGVIVRLIQYLNNRSLWSDEVNLALNIINRTYGELAQTLDYNQAAPLGFLWLEKFLTQIWGNHEYVLRLLPFIASIIALGFFYQLVNLYCSTLAAPIAIALFAFGRYTVYYATELKPYSSDLAIALVLFWVLIKICHQILTTQKIVIVALLGSLSIWFSYPSIFILGGIEGCYLLTASTRKIPSLLINRIPIYLTWILSFVLLYFLNIANALNNQELSSSWSARYPQSFGDIFWLFDALGRFFYRPMGFSGMTDGVGILAFIIGCFIWYHYNRLMFWTLITPFIATLIAAYLQQYPFRERLILFLVPMAMLIMAEGIRWLLDKYLVNPRRNFLWGLLGIFFITALIVPAMFRVTKLIVNPELKHEFRPVIEYVASQVKPEDTTYIYAAGNQAFLYYGKHRDYFQQDYILGSVDLSSRNSQLSQDWQQLKAEIKSLQGKSRVWFILYTNSDRETEIISYLNQLGQQIDSFQKPEVSAYLYDLTYT